MRAANINVSRPHHGFWTAVTWWLHDSFMRHVQSLDQITNLRALTQIPRNAPHGTFHPK
jgi:hypothetical protein